MSARDTVLGKIRASMRVPAADEVRRSAVADRLESTPTGVIPGRAKLPKAGQVDLFCAMAEQFGATLTRVSDYKAVAGGSDHLSAVTQFARRNPDGCRQAAEESRVGNREEPRNPPRGL
jgi:hypothetical protein